MNAEEIYDAAEMRDGKGFTDEGHRAGLAAVVAAAKAEALEDTAALIPFASGEMGVQPNRQGIMKWLRARAAAIREAVQS